MRKILLVAWREFKHTALTKAFLVAAVFTPLAVLGVMVLMPALTKTTMAPLRGTLAVVEPSGRLASMIAAELTPEKVALTQSLSMRHGGPMLGQNDAMSQLPGVPKLPTVPLPQIDIKVETQSTDADLAALKNRVRDHDLVALAVISPKAMASDGASGDNTFELFVASDASPHHTEMFDGAISQAIVRARVETAGLNLDKTRQLVREPYADIKRLGAGGGEVRESAAVKIFIPIAFMMLLWITTFTSGNYLLTSTIEEKSNKVMEVLLSAVSPFQLMAGKILGQAGVSFIMLGMYAGAGLTTMAALAMADLIPPILLLYLFLYFIMAFFMVAAIMAGVGSAVSELRDAQSLITPAMLVLMIPLLLWFPISNDPNGMLATITSFLPPLTPFVMILRVTTATEPVPFWQIVSSLVAGYCWTVIMVWGCAKIFRIGVLMYGKPPTPLELIKWVRYR